MENFTSPSTIFKVEEIPNQALSEGIRDIHLGKGNKHPVEEIQLGFQRAEDRRLLRLSSLFGGHAALKIQMENTALAGSTRLPGLPSSLLGLQIHMGMNDTLESAEILGSESPEMPYPRGSLHSYVERQFGI
ncbi:proteasome maturation factor ump1 protein [Cardiosporidium cionae]|uniref:Proteasome maturation factor ump1 protein n=1 Tax=Cardiosporidium cionae TaxID=476202 RepID=A0ABQ7J8Y7_9APIC|nr:proteasome maturation factor ump1 protein [Cardiosporidium cionae]|eukprot:KAF8820462.1 proteasome maturation factor ump1 protein [Cardiosporidium cionae]